MSNPPKQKGTAGETAAVRYFNAHGFPHAERRVLKGSADQGDILICPGIIAEVKNYHLPTGFPGPSLLDKWLDEAETERKNAGALMCVLIVKRKGTTDVGQWFVFTRPWPDDGTWWMEPVSSWVKHMRTNGYGTPWEEEAS